MRKFFLIVISLIFAYVIFFLDQTYIWAKLANFSNNTQSKFYIYCLNRVYSNTECNKKEYFEKFEKENDLWSKLIWLRILSVSGNQHLSKYIDKNLNNYIRNNNKDLFFYNLISATGFLGDYNLKYLLFQILQDDKSEKLEKMMAITNLYLIEGKNYSEKFKIKWTPSEEMKNAKNIILKTKNSCRSIDEMIELDSLLRSKKIDNKLMHAD